MSDIRDATLENPFPGLRPYQEQDKHLFFGRERQFEAMVEKLEETRFLAVVGASGSGKSSLVNCGLRPALHRGLMAKAGTTWRIAILRPGDDPMNALAKALATPGVLYPKSDRGVPLEEIVDTYLHMNEAGILEVYKKAPVDPDVNLLVVVDQFEELFRYWRLGKEQKEEKYKEEAISFVDLLLEVRKYTALPVYVTLTMRSDFLGDCTRFPGLAEAINEGQFLVPRMMRLERSKAIAGPVGVGRLDLMHVLYNGHSNGHVHGEGPIGEEWGQISPLLLNRLVNDVGDQPDQLSILQHALNRTWARWRNEGNTEGPLNVWHYEAVGTMDRALDLHADEAYNELRTDQKKKICEKVFRALTDTGTDARGIRRPTRLGMLCQLTNASREEVTEVINVFREPSRSFMMPPHPDELIESTVIDISHESLMRVWGRLKKWVEEEAQHARTYRRIAETAVLFKEGKAKEWREQELENALDWMEAETPSESWANQYGGNFEEVNEFLLKSIELREKEKKQKSRARVLRLFAIGMAIMATIALVFGFISQRTAEEAVKAQNVALAAQRLAEEQRMKAQRQQEIANKNAEEAHIARSEALAANEVAEEQRMEAQRQQDIAFEKVEEAEIAKQNAQMALESQKYYSEVADEKRLEANKNLVGLFEERAERILFEKREQEYHYAWMNTLYALIQDIGGERLPYSLGRLLLPELQPGYNSPSDGYWEIEMAPTGEKVKFINHYGPGMQGVVEKPFSAILGTENMENPELCPWGAFNCIEWSRIHLWKLDAYSTKEVMISDSFVVPRVTAASFSPDGGTLILAHALMEWDSNQILKPLKGKISRWNVDNSNLIKDDAEHQSENVIHSLAFNQNGGFFASGDNKGTVTVWNSQNVDDTITPLFSDTTNAAIRSIQMSAGGRYVAVVNANNDIVLWDGSQSPLEPRYLNPGDDLIVHTVVFSNNDSLLAMGNAEGIKIWDLTMMDGTLRPVFDNVTGEVYSLAFSQSDDYLAVGNRTGVLRVLDVETRLFSQELDTTYVVPGNSILKLVFSQDGERIASAHQDGIITLWGVEGLPSGPKLTTEAIFQAHQDRVLSVNFGDRKTLESVAEDGTIRNVNLHVSLFGKNYDLGVILADDSVSDSILQEMYESSINTLGLQLEGREFVSNDSVDVGDITEYYGSSMRAFTLAGGNFYPVFDSDSSILWVQVFDESDMKGILTHIDWVREEENTDSTFIYLTNASLAKRIRIPAPFSDKKYAEIQLGTSDSWRIWYPVYPVYQQLDEGIRMTVFVRDDNFSNGNYYSSYFQREDLNWTFYINGRSEILFKEMGRDKQWVYLERGKKGRKLLGTTIQKDTIEKYRMPIWGGELQKMVNREWVDVESLGGQRVYSVFPMFNPLRFPSSSFQQLSETSPRSWVHVFEKEDLAFADMDQNSRNEAHIFEFYYKEVRSRDDWIYLQDDADDSYTLRLTGGKAEYNYYVNAEDEFYYSELYQIEPWYQIDTETLSFEGRNVTYSNVVLNERQNTLRVFPGEPVELSFDWRVTVAESGSCPGCLVQIYLGIEDNFSHCFLSDEIPPRYYKGRSGKTSREFIAPRDPGIYFITQRETREYACDEDPAKHENSPSRAVGAIWVVQHPESGGLE